PLHQTANERLAKFRLPVDGGAFARDHVAEHLYPVVLVQHAVDLEALRPRLGAMLPKKFPSALTCFSTNAFISAAASMVTLLTFLSSIPVALIKAGQSWKSPLPRSKATV